MKKEKHILINNIHRYFGVEFHNTSWKYFENENRTEEDTDDMINYVHSSLHHWKLFSGGKIVNVQRGEYMIAKAYAIAGNKQEALTHAKKCLEITKKNSKEMEDFDFMFAYEIMAFAEFINGNKTEFKKYKHLTEKSIDEVKDKRDREICIKEFDTTLKRIKQKK